MDIIKWDDYEVYKDEVLGKGGWGVVYKGKQISLNRPVALKVLKKDLTDDPEFVKRFFREASTLARLINDHIVQVYGAGESGDSYYFAMEYVDGLSLKELIKEKRFFNFGEIIHIALGIAQAIKAAWNTQEKIVHRDIKPGNVMLTFGSTTFQMLKDKLSSHGETLVVDVRKAKIKVMDFGLAKLRAEEDITQPGTVMGTPAYMSPEQASGEACDIRSDIYSVGVVLYELCAGKKPFSGDSFASLISQIMTKTPPPPKQFNKQLPDGLNDVIMKCLSKKPDDRYATPGKLIRALINENRAIRESRTSPQFNTVPQSMIETVEEDLTPTDISSPKQSNAKRPALKFGIISFVILSILAVSFVVYNKYGKTNPPPQDTRENISNHTISDNKIKNTNIPKPLLNNNTVNNDNEIKANSDTQQQNNDVQKVIPPPEKNLAVFNELREQFHIYIQNNNFANAEITLTKIAKEFPDSTISINSLQNELNSAKKDFAFNNSLVQGIKLCINKVNSANKAEAQYNWESALSFYNEILLSFESIQKKFQNAQQKAEEMGFHISLVKEKAKLMAQKVSSRKQLYMVRGEAKVLKNNEEYLKAINKYEEAKAFATNIDEETLVSEEIKACKEALVGSVVLVVDELIRKKKWFDASEVLKKAENKIISSAKVVELRGIINKAIEALPKDMIYIPEGEFYYASENKKIFLPHFLMDKTEVTNEMYYGFLNEINKLHDTAKYCHPSEEKGEDHIPLGWKDGKYPEGEGKLPVTGVNWFDAWAYAKWAGKRLPTLEEWAKAAGGTMGNLWPWGNEFINGNANTYEAERRSIAFPGSFTKDVSPFGCFDMAGNVSEWVNGFWDNKKGILAGVVASGGNFFEDKKSAQTTYKSRYFPKEKNRYVGFRCAKDM